MIGGGAAGTSITLALIEQGARLTLVDADALGSGSSGRSVGVVGTQMTDPFQIELRRHSIARVRDWEGRGLRFNHIGYLRLARTEAQMEALERLQRMQAGAGFEARLYPRDQLREVVPHLSTEGLAGGIFRPNEGFLHPSELCSFLETKLRAKGGAVRQFCKATGARRAPGGFRLGTTGGPVDCDVVVNAASAWAPRIAALFGQVLHIHAEPHEALSGLLDQPLGYVMPMVMDLIDGHRTGLNFRHEKPTELISEIHKVKTAPSENPDACNDQCGDSAHEMLAELLMERVTARTGGRGPIGWGRGSCGR